MRTKDWLCDARLCRLPAVRIAINCSSLPVIARIKLFAVGRTASACGARHIIVRRFKMIRHIAHNAATASSSGETVIQITCANTGDRDQRLN
jgi:hypothetical protein